MPDRMNTVALEDWHVRFVMKAGRSERQFNITIPADSEDAARYVAYELGLAINVASGHIWKMTKTVSVEVAA